VVFGLAKRDFSLSLHPAKSNAAIQIGNHRRRIKQIKKVQISSLPKIVKKSDAEFRVWH
jgi:hypothetical protein